MNIEPTTTTIDKAELLQLKIVLPLIAFALPFFISGPQLLTGTLVNSFLFIASVKLSQKNNWPIIILPSLGALARGVLFGPFTPFLLFFLPFIWCGNALLIKSFLILKKSYSSPVAVVFSSLIKASVLYISAQLYFHLHLIPKLFLSSMGAIQFLTAVLGGILTLLAFKLAKNNHE